MQMPLGVQVSAPRSFDEALRDAFRALPKQVRARGFDWALNDAPLAKCLRITARVLMEKSKTQ